MNSDGDPTPHAIIAGFGLPGRLVAESLQRQGFQFAVIDRNQATAHRCTTVCVVVGDIRDELVLRQAGIERAVLYVITIPDDHAIVEAVALAKRLNPDLRIVVRTNYTSTGMRARQHGAAEVIVAEQLIAREMACIVRDEIPAGPAQPVSSNGMRERR